MREFALYERKVRNTMFAFMNLGAQEMIVLLIIGVLLFGRKLPEVGRYLGKSIVEFKKGIKGLEDEYESIPNDSFEKPKRIANKTDERV
jgi:sec-independent protein translocase protein TatA